MSAQADNGLLYTRKKPLEKIRPVASSSRGKKLD